MPIQDASSLFKQRLSSQEAMEMIRVVSEEEIKEAMFGIGDCKAAGPDGYTAYFFKKAWAIVGKDICQAIREFFLNGKLLGEVNSTILSLIPKVPNPVKVTDYRPIACCNVLYKCISKIITNRIKPSLHSLINECQSAFVPGRLIHDNILLSQELLKGYNCKNGAKRCALKVDIAKAYDTVSWSFLETVLGHFGFHEVMIKWIMTCVSTASFSICINGDRHGFFKSGRGLRQGDPISPYLFTLIMEVFSLLMARNTQTSDGFKYHKGCKATKLTHLSFADDLLVLCHGDHSSIKVVRDTLDEFSAMSGLKPNMGKSTIFFGSVNTVEQRKILEVMPFQVGSLPVKYLGVPLLAKKIGIQDCKNLVDRVRDRISDWKLKFLSYAGRLQLVASVLTAMQSYWASVLLIPKSVIHDIEKLLKGFLWNLGKSVKGRAKVAWSLVCRPKSEGGLGIKQIGTWNEALLTKLIWKIMTAKGNIWVDWINEVKLKGKSFWEVEANQTDSGTWRAMLELRQKIRPFIVSTIGNGRSTFMWFDSWNEVGPLCNFIPLKAISDARFQHNAKVDELISNNEWIWPDDWYDKYPILNQVKVPILNQGSVDQVKWKNKERKLVEFSASEAWDGIRNGSNKVHWWKFVWFSQCNPRCAVNLWMAVLGRLQTQDRMLKWCTNSLICPLCNLTNDSHNHLFFQCDFSAKVWEVMKGKMKAGNMPDKWDLVVQKMASMKCNNAIWSVLDRLIVATTVYNIWKERNDRLFRLKNQNVEGIVRRITESVRLQLMSLTVRRSPNIIKVAAEWNVQFKFLTRQ